ncbi:MAG: hypothetical protein COT73_02120, partial [Bdellovibrio sp. CG10_big_fil_rev_8_21_14_0_10_47_8]
LENTPSDGESGTHWFLSTWQDWLIDHKSILSLLTISFFIVFGLIQWLRSPDKVQNFTKSEENLKANRLPATKEETSYKKPEKLKASDRVNPQAHKEYAPNRELPIERTHEDENGTTIIRYV